MKTLWICLTFAFVASATSLNSDEDGWYEDYWYDDDIGKQSQENGKEPSLTTISEEEHASTKKEILSWLSKLTAPETTQENFDEYQFEDNRSEVNEDGVENTKITPSDRTEDNDLAKTTLINENESQSSASTIDADTIMNSSNDTPKLSTRVYSDENIIEMTKDILNEDTDNDFADIKPTLDSEDTDGMKKIIEETNKLFDSDKSESIDEEPSTENAEEEDVSLFNKSTVSTESQEASEEDTLNKAFTDLMAELDMLQETRDKLQDSKDENENDFSVHIGEDAKTEKLSSVEDNDYEEIADSNLDQLFDNNESDDNFEGSDEDIDDDLIEDAVEVKETTLKSNEPIQYLNDALMASEPENKNSNNVNEKLTSTVSSFTSEAPEEELVLSASTTSKPTDDLSSAEIEKLMVDFTDRNQHLMQITANDVRNAEQIRLTVETPVEITSPLYPRPYPTNQTKDWMFTGNGMGIELNITDFGVNGHVGDYVLVKPGGEDESGSTGLLFSYTLNSPRRYRFLDVDRMFIRFGANVGIQFYTGFKMSARMIIPRPGLPEPEPEPEALMPEPKANITLNLGGITLEEFIQVEERFRQIVADMATMYINSNGIDPGLNTTLETTQITSRALCFHNWPKFEHCAEVRFGVPLVYENATEGNARLNEKDLTDMWETYSVRDPFASRLRMLGIMEYQVPNDRGVLTVWLVVAGGVVLSMAMLAFALWRFSCFADYSRMPSFSDTDSVNEKRNLDLYPTPHQTLPPLYTETDYKWADAKYDDTTKVEIGGYSNKSYMHNDFYNFDSDEEVLPARDRSSGISPRDIYNV